MSASETVVPRAGPDPAAPAVPHPATVETPPGLGPRHAVFVDSVAYHTAAWGGLHPLAIDRNKALAAVVDALGWRPPAARADCAPAARTTLARFHSAAYIEALYRADRDGRVDRQERETYALGTMENPVFPGVFNRAATTVGGSIAAAELALRGCTAFHPAGGTHHGQPAQASGFCYFNDPVFAILTLLDAGIDRVLYVDFDAHHGDGVEAAFEGESRVHVCSLHEANRWPYTGPAELSFARRRLNIPLPRACSDARYARVFESQVMPFAWHAEPEAVVVTCGADALAGDPLSSMNVTNRTLWHAVERLCALTPHAVVLGGGGYNPWTAVRCWAGLWARLAGIPIPERLPDGASAVLRGLSCDLVDDEDLDPAWWCTMADDAPVHADADGGGCGPHRAREAER